MTTEEDMFLREVLGPQRDPITGLFPTNPRNPRRKRAGRFLNFNDIVQDFFVAHGGYVEDAIITIFSSMLTAASLGDVGAAKLLLDRLCGKDADVLDVVLSTQKLSDVERAARVSSLLQIAAQRGEQTKRITVEPTKN